MTRSGSRADAADALIVGAGVFGASLARELADRDWNVTLLDTHDPGHARSTSGDNSRFMRFVYRDDPGSRYTRSALTARRRWLEIGEEAGTELLVEPGHMWLITEEEGWEQEAIDRSRDAGGTVEVIDAATAADALPGLVHDDIRYVIHEPDAGILRARTAVQELVRQAVARGAVFRYGRATPVADGLIVDGVEHGADRVIWACGAWLATLFGDLVELDVRQADEFYFGVDSGWRAADVPAWVDPTGCLFGFGDLDGFGVKAMHSRHDGPIIDPDVARRVASTEKERDTREALARRFPELAVAPLIGSHVCQYELTADRHFIAGPLPGQDAVWILGGGSAHGFKHGPALAQHVAAVLEGDEEPDPIFAVGPRQPAAAVASGSTGPAR